LEDELFNLKRSLEDETSSMYQANDEISKMVEELFETQLKLVISMKLVKIDKYMEKIRQSNDAKDYSEINTYINKIQLLIDDPQDKIFRRLDIYENLKKRLSFEKENLQKKLETQFNSLVSLRSKSFPKTKAINVVISKDLEALVETTNSMIEIDYNFNETADYMMKNIFEPVVSRAVSVEFVENGKDISMTFSYSTGEISDDLRPNHTTVFTNINHVLCFFMHMNIMMKNEEFLFPYILKDRYDDFLRMILDECLVHSIPTTFEERDQSTLTKDIEELSKLFVKCNFKEGKENLEKYPAEIDKLFYKKFIKNITSKSAEILKRDLHDMIMVSEDTTLSTETPLTFPKSMISKSTLEVVRLLEKIIAEAKKCDESSNEKRQNLLIAVKAVLENYPFSIQLHHSRFMSQIPQQSALFYNNCMYLSNWAMNNRDTENCPGIEVVSEDLETQGLEILEVQIAKQKIQLIDVLKEFGK
jgi:protein transport protein DSL1/ZW10